MAPISVELDLLSAAEARRLLSRRLGQNGSRRTRVGRRDHQGVRRAAAGPGRRGGQRRSEFAVAALALAG